ncbi:MAG: metallophosphoesterase [Tepidisphaeraceae bacterium]
MDVIPEEVIEAFATAAEENQLSPLRAGQVVHLPAEGEVWITGDLHDHRHNLNKLLAAADLANNPRRHLILHELIHGEHVDPDGAEDSWQTLYRAACLKCDFPGQVHFLLANHDLAQIHGEGIMKGGVSVCEAFNKGMKRDFKDQRGKVVVAMTELLLSFPLGVRCPNGLFVCHSLPTDKQIETFDYTVFDRALTGPDYARKTGPAYQLIWGRGVTPDGAAQFADKLVATVVITGHQPQESGFLVNGDRHLIIASDHNQGVFLPLDLARSYDMPALVECLTKFVALET